MLPFIYLVIHTDNSTNIDKLLMKAFKSDEEFLNHAQNILQLVDKLSNTNDKNAYILIRGYIIKHIEMCQEAACPLKFQNGKGKGGGGAGSEPSVVPGGPLGVPGGPLGVPGGPLGGSMVEIE